ncbi:hypothetical protein ACHAWF_011283 [Thalassiosira exigua]
MNIVKPFAAFFAAVGLPSTSAQLRKKGRMGHGRGRGGGMGYGGGGWGQGGGGGGMGYGGGGWGWGQGGGGMGGGGMGSSNGDAMDLIHALLDNRGFIDRDWYDYTEGGEVGIEAWTNSTDPTVGGWIQDHVFQMMNLMESGGRIRNWDPVFYELFANRDLHQMYVENITDAGVYGVYVAQTTSGVDDDERNCIAELIRAHAGVLSEFIQRGYPEMGESHDVPDDCVEVL